MGGPDPAPPLPQARQDDLIKGTKYAQLRIGTGDNEAYFTGTAGYMMGAYGAEGHATCAKGRLHPHGAPDADCTCGFWVPVRKESALSYWDSAQVQLEVEIGGRIIECGKDPLPAPPWGYRAQWQRILSVSLPKDCGMRHFRPGECIGAPNSLVIQAPDRRVMTACMRHSVGEEVISKPLSWLRQSLRTEIRPGWVTDDPEEGLNGWREAIKVVSRDLCPLSVMKPYLPENLYPGQRIHVCADLQKRVVYELRWTGIEWQVASIFHPMLTPWGWGSPA